MQLPFFLRISVVLILIATCANVGVFVRADDATPNRMHELVQQLGNDSFRDRERAAEELLSYGMQSKAALFFGMNDQELEIALRCGSLWDEVRIEAGWKHVRGVLGDSPESRDLYDQMFLAAPAAWYELAETPRATDVLFEERRTQLKEQLIDRRPVHWNGALANLLYFGIRVKTELPQKELPRLDELLGVGRSQQALADIEPLRRLLEDWKSATSTDGPAFDRLLLALRDRRPQAVEIAREILRNNETPAKQRQYALLALMNTDSPEDEELVDVAIEDSSSLDVLLSNGLLVRSQLRDVALAVRITRDGQNPAKFGFDFLRPNEFTFYSPSSLGFKDQTERTAAFERWSAFTSRHVLEAGP